MDAFDRERRRKRRDAEKGVIEAEPRQAPGLTEPQVRALIEAETVTIVTVIGREVKAIAKEMVADRARLDEIENIMRSLVEAESRRTSHG